MKRLRHPRNHDLFKNINWKKIEQKKIEPSLKVSKVDSFHWIQIHNKIDEDYTEQNYNENRI